MLRRCRQAETSQERSDEEAWRLAPRKAPARSGNQQYRLTEPKLKRELSQTALPLFFIFYVPIIMSYISFVLANGSTASSSYKTAQHFWYHFML